MTQRNLLILTLLAAVVISAALFMQPVGEQAADQGAGEFLPGLREQANELNSISLTLANNESLGHFSQVEGRWIASNPAGYPADWETIRTLVAGLVEARITEDKTANPEYYERLGVRDTSDPAAAGIRVDLASATDRWSVIIGNKAESRKGYYARIPDQAGSVLIDQELNLPREPLGWLESAIIDVPAGEVQSISIRHPGKAAIEIAKSAPGDSEFVLQNVPQDRTAKTGYMISGIASGLSGLEMLSVRAPDSVAFSAPVNLLVRTFDGRVINADLEQIGEEYFIRLQASFQAAAAIEADEDEAAAVEAMPAANDDDASVEPGTDPEAWVNTLNAEKAAWVFAIPEYKYEALTREQEDLLEAESE